MATTLQEIARYLDNRQWRYQLEPEQNRILTGVKGNNIENLLIIIQLSEGGEFLHLYTPQLLKIKDNVFKGLAFQTLLNISWGVKMLRFEYDTVDGEVRASIEFPLEDSSLTEKQFNRCLSGLIDLSDRVTMPRLNKVLASGEDPGSQQLHQSLLDAMPEELLDLMEQMLALRRQQEK